MYWFQGRLAEVEPLFARGLAFSRRVHGEDHPDTALAMFNMAVLLHRLGRYDEERPLLDSARFTIYPVAPAEALQLSTTCAFPAVAVRPVGTGGAAG